jgi:hypothetical protein
MKNFLSGFAPAVALSLPLAAAAQAAPDPAAASLSAPLTYASAFAGYQPWTDIQPGNWRELNDGLLRPPAHTPAHPPTAAGHGHGAAPGAPAAGHATPVPDPHAGHAPAGARR